MKLHLRLALPLFAVAGAVTLAGTVGVVVLVRTTFGVAQKQSGDQLARIADNVLKGRARNLTDAAEWLAKDPGNFSGRARSLRGTRLDAASLADPRTGTALRAYGSAIEVADLKGLGGDLPALVILRSADGLLITGTARTADGRVAVAAQRFDVKFASALKELLRADITVSTEGKETFSTLKDTSAEPYYPARLVIRTSGGAPVELAILVPAGGAFRARRTALALTVAGGAILLVLALLFYWYTVVQVTRPIRDLISAADRVAAGDLESRLPAEAPAELGALIRQFNAMAVALRETREKLVHSAKLSSVGALVAGVSHELNNPLLGLLGHAEYLSAKIGAGEPGREELDIILSEGRRMKKTLADLRGFLRPSEAVRIRMDVNSVVSEVLTLVRHDASGTGIKCATELHPSGAHVNGSPDQVRQVILNVTLNSIQAMPGGGSLTIRTTVAGAAVRITVADTGAGIAPEHRARITEPFFSTKPGRMGLGLAICRDILDRHGGKLTVDSGPGCGTRVTIELPMDKS